MHFWARGYAVSTVRFELEQVRQYIREQDHADGTSRAVLSRYQRRASARRLTKANRLEAVPTHQATRFAGGLTPLYPSQPVGPLARSQHVNRQAPVRHRVRQDGIGQAPVRHYTQL